MSVATIANRYARALADVIVERREVTEVAAELKQFAAMIEGHAQLREVFASPVVAPERKRAVLNELIARLKARQTVQNFLQLLLANNRLHQLMPMVQALEKELDARTNVVTAEIITARNINADEQKLLHDKLKALTGKDVRLHYKTDPDIIGGVVTRIGSKIYDGSIKNQLAQMKARLMQ
ncbi:MAG: ATP synthase F1 subunit delta [Acidobacteria bacterium]|nr:ATP synthase F1 subunit delta [Acidobacteriota bacterium]MBI3426697.1 ATP synthase F1 subunit delta [Acidobacteriota bacterium]